MRNTRSAAELLSSLVGAAASGVCPPRRSRRSSSEHVPVDRPLTVTASPAKVLDATVQLAERLSKQGYSVVRHLAARMVRDREQLAEICDRLTTAGISSVFVPAGDKTPPEGVYDSALSMLVDLTELGRPFADVGITGYPESHPLIDDDVTIQSMWDKRQHATSIVSNLVFDPDAVDRWLLRMRARGIMLPLWLGVPGPVERAKLLAMATKIGVGESSRFLVKHKGTLPRPAAPGGFTGERFLEQCAPALARPGAAVEGLHVFTFNQVAETEAWRTTCSAGSGREGAHDGTWTRQNSFPSGSAITRQWNPCSLKSSEGSRVPPRLSTRTVAASMDLHIEVEAVLRGPGSGTRWKDTTGWPGPAGTRPT